MKAYLKNYRQAPRKVRLVADMIRGKRVREAIVSLSFLPKKAALPIQKLVKSAAANAAQAGKSDQDALRIKDIRVDKGITFKRFMPRARGRAAPVDKHASHVTLILEEIKK